MSIKGAFEYIFHYLNFMPTTRTVILFQLSNGDILWWQKKCIHRSSWYLCHRCIYVTYPLIHVTFMYMYLLRHICNIFYKVVSDKLPFLPSDRNCMISLRKIRMCIFKTDVHFNRLYLLVYCMQKLSKCIR